MLVVLTTTPDETQARELGQKIVEEKLAACVQIVPRVTSIYFWKGEVQNDSEYLLLIKTLEEKFEDLSEFIQTNHSYEVPEIVAIDAEKVSEAYLKWMERTVQIG